MQLTSTDSQLGRCVIFVTNVYEANLISDQKVELQLRAAGYGRAAKKEEPSKGWFQEAAQKGGIDGKAIHASRTMQLLLAIDRRFERNTNMQHKRSTGAQRDIPDQRSEVSIK